MSNASTQSDWVAPKPGSWTFDGPPHNHIVWSGPNQRVCFLTSDGPTTENARLIAAAPTMLHALRRAVLALAFAAETSEAMRDDYEAVSAAIAEATGLQGEQ